ncbi:DMT family transporter [Evansella sp. AB-rgal1]|uniref:DMT family transporter n=1 Tax=Evansella sp. AB-rgal1 TaxID=3242696 RepID=UPI00359EFEC0
MKEKSLLFTYGIGIIFFVMVTWGLNVVMLKVLIEYFPPVTMTAVRILLAGIVAISMILVSMKMRKLTKKEWFYTICGGLLGIAAHHYFLTMGLTLTNASNAVLILALVPVTTSIFAVIFLGDVLTKWRLLGMGLAFSGVVLTQGGGQGSVSLGDFYIFISMAVQALSFIFIRKATITVDPRQMTSMMLLIGAIGVLIVSFILEPGSITQMIGAPWSIYVIFFVSAVLSTAVGHFLFNAAIKRIGAGQTAVFNNFVPFIGLVGSAIFLNEQIYWYQSFGFLIIVLGVLFGTGYMEKTFFKKKHDDSSLVSKSRAG